MAEAESDDDDLSFALNNLAATHLLAGELSTAFSLYERAFKHREMMGDPAWSAFALANVGKVTFLLGEWATARDYLERAVGIARSMGRSWYTTYPLIYVAQVDVAEGHIATAVASLEEAVANAEASRDLHALRFAQAVLAESDLLSSRFDSARCRLEPLLDRPGLEEQDVILLLPLLAVALLGLGRLHEAADMVSAAVTRASAHGCLLYLVDGLRVKGTVLAELREWFESDEAFSQALSVARSMPYPYAEGLVLYEHGRARRLKSETGAGRKLLSEARTIFQLLGAGTYLERAKLVERSPETAWSKFLTDPQPACPPRSVAELTRHGGDSHPRRGGGRAPPRP
jgi:tetratricopeptide (TPR) repeat protein